MKDSQPKKTGSRNDPCLSVPDQLTLSLFFMTIFLFFILPLDGPDLPWHLKTGEFILQTGGIPTQDPFSFSEYSISFVGKFLLSQYWLAQVLMMAIYSLFGPGGLIFLTALMFTLIALLLWSLIRKNNLLLTIFILGGYTMHFLYGFQGLRPQTFSFLFTVLLIWLVEKFKESSSTIYLLPLPCIMLVWANMHGGFIFGIVIMAIYLINDVVMLRWNKLFMDSVTAIDFYRLLAFVILSILISSLNPNGLMAFTYVFQTHTTEIFYDILEYQSPLNSNAISSSIMLQFWLSIPISLLCLGLSIRHKNIWSSLMISITMVMSFSAIRYFPLMIIATTSSIRNININMDNNLYIKKYSIHNTITIIALLIINLVSSQHINWRTFRFTESPLNPERAIAFLKNNKINGNIFSSYNKSGYIIFGLYPPSKVFWSSNFVSSERFNDGKLIGGEHVGSGDLIKLLCRIVPKNIGMVTVNEIMNNGTINDPAWQDKFNSCGADIVVHEAMNIFSGKPYPLVFLLMNRADWKLVYLDGNVVVFLKDLPKFRDHIKLLNKPKHLFFDQLIAEGKQTSGFNSSYFPAIEALGYILKGNSGEHVNGLIKESLLLDPNNEIGQFDRLLNELQAQPPEKRKLRLNISLYP